MLDREELEWRAAHDRLTGLMNRSALEKKLEEVMAWTPRSGSNIGVLYCDIDDSKSINDTYGHKAGDKVLKVSADRMARILRPSDVVARIGGDEFVVILNAVQSVNDCIRIGEALRNEVARPLDIDGQEVSRTMSFGAAMAESADTPEGVLDRADVALYRAKSAKNDVAAFTHR